MEKMIQMRSSEFDVLVKENGEITRKRLPGYVFSLLDVEFGCSNKGIINDELIDCESLYLYDLETGYKCAKAVSRRAFSNIITPQFVEKLNAAKQKLYKIEN